MENAFVDTPLLKKTKFSGNSGWISPSFKPSSCETKKEKTPSQAIGSTKRKLNKHLKSNTNCKNENLHTWTDIFKPQSKEELAVHKKKVCEVEEWFIKNITSQPISNHQYSILILTGPAGAGKTATVRVLAEEFKVEINEWSHSLYDGSSGYNSYKDGRYQADKNLNIPYESHTSLFKTFLLRASKYPSLFCTNSKKVILVEEFPNVFLRDPASFHCILRSFCKNSRCPAIFIISDSTKGQSIENQLFPKNLQMELKITNINFNPVAPTMLSKVINKINSNAKAFNRNSLSQNDIESIASDCNGDIRNAINLLHFLSSKSKTSNSNGSAISTKCKKGSKKKKTESDSTMRDSSLFLFHALGKVLYCKRDMTKPSDREQLPLHLQHHERHPLLSVPESIFERTAISADGFSLFLHENYLSFVDDIDNTELCSDSFSQVDALCSEWTGRDVLNEYAASLVARNLMFNLRPSSLASRWRPLHKPQYFSSQKEFRSSCVQLRNTFKDYRLSSKELQTDLVPYLYKIGVPPKNEDQRKAVLQFGKLTLDAFSRKKFDSLSEKDVIKDDMSAFEDNVFTNTTSIETTNENVALDAGSDEEYVIEEFDDD